MELIDYRKYLEPPKIKKEYVCKCDICDEEISGYLEAYKKFRSDYPTWRLLHSEFRIINHFSTE